jgi:hypothetical protein
MEPKVLSPHSQKPAIGHYTKGTEFSTLHKRNRVGGCELDSSYSGMGPMVGSCEHGN